MYNGSDEGFRNIWKLGVYVCSKIGAAWDIAYGGNSIAIWLTTAVVAAGITSYFVLKFRIISPEWIAKFDLPQRGYYETIRDYVCSTNLFTIGIFFISSVIFILVNSMSIQSAGYPFSQSDLAVVSFVGKAVVVVCVLYRAIKLAVALVQLPSPS